MPTVSSRRWPAAVLAAVLAPALLAALACHSDATSPAGPTVAAVAGAYALTSVSGQALPAAVTGTSVITMASQATRTLNADGTCSESGTYATQYPLRQPVTFTGTAMTCTWTLSGRTVTTRLVSNQLAYGGFAATTTATYADDGTLTETSAEVNGLYIYPRVYRR